MFLRFWIFLCETLQKGKINLHLFYARIFYSSYFLSLIYILNISLPKENVNLHRFWAFMSDSIFSSSLNQIYFAKSSKQILLRIKGKYVSRCSRQAPFSKILRNCQLGFEKCCLISFAFQIAINLQSSKDAFGKYTLKNLF